MKDRTCILCTNEIPPGSFGFIVSTYIKDGVKTAFWDIGLVGKNTKYICSKCEELVKDPIQTREGLSNCLYKAREELYEALEKIARIEERKN